ncbi:TPA: hypothetical protein ACPI9Z_001401, partial [Haemophilus influenzae]
MAQYGDDTKRVVIIGSNSLVDRYFSSINQKTSEILADDTSLSQKLWSETYPYFQTHHWLITSALSLINFS